MEDLVVEEPRIGRVRVGALKVHARVLLGRIPLEVVRPPPLLAHKLRLRRRARGVGVEKGLDVMWTGLRWLRGGWADVCGAVDAYSPEGRSTRPLRNPSRESSCRPHGS